MNILIADSWLREYLKTSAIPEQIKDCLSLCGPSVERVSKVGDDFVYDIEITSNRVDMGSVYGIAREAAAILPRFGIEAKLNQYLPKEFKSPETKLPFSVTDTNKLCNRILAVVLENVSVEKSPEFMKDRLEKSGTRSLNNLIDITNYVMTELGHPSHVFDYDRIKTNKFIIRRANAGETIITLDKKEYRLDNEDIIIDDGTGRVIDFPGIMGTENSVVIKDTKRIIFFIESNNPVAIRRSSMRYGIRTVAATINEKHPDPELAKTALLRGIELYEEFCGAIPVSDIIDIYPHKSKPQPVNVSVDFVNDRLGVKLTKDEIVSILTSLHFSVEENNNRLIATPPSFRQFDVTIPEDIVEEVARIYGYHRLPTKLPAGNIPITDKPKDLSLESKVKTMLKYWGFTEVYNYSFISKKLIEKANLEITDHLKVANPLTRETEYMRRSLIPAVLENVEYNQHLKDNLALFELSKVYLPKSNDLPDEKSELIIVCQTDFFKLKGMVTALFAELGISNFNQVAGDDWKFGHPKQTLLFKKDKGIIAKLANLHPQLANNFQLKNKLFIAEIDFDKLVAYFQPVKKYHPIPSFPPVIEDLTLTITTDIKIGLLIEELEKIDPLISHAELLDKYKDAITVRITYQDLQRNLTGDDVKKVREKILSVLNNKFSLHLKLSR